MTFRVSNPAGFAGMGLTHGVTFSLLAALLRPGSGLAWTVFGATLGAQWGAAWAASRTLRFPIPGLPLVVLAASVVESAGWVGSWANRTVWWAGQKWRVRRNGKLSAARRG